MNQQLLFKSTALCAGSEHCCYEIEEKLKKWGATPEETAEILDYLLEEKYIDEERFSKAYSKDKMRYNHWGRQKIDQGMRLLHINSMLRKQALSELPEQEYREILTTILKSKVRSIKARNDYELTGKLMRFALGRGFEMTLIRECLPAMSGDEACDVSENMEEYKDIDIED